MALPSKPMPRGEKPITETRDWSPATQAYIAQIERLIEELKTIQETLDDHEARITALEP